MSDFIEVLVVRNNSKNNVAKPYRLKRSFFGRGLHPKTSNKFVSTGSLFKPMPLPTVGAAGFSVSPNEFRTIGKRPDYTGDGITEADLVNGTIPPDVGWYGRFYNRYGKHQGESPVGLLFSNDDTWMTTEKVKKSELPDWWFD